MSGPGPKRSGTLPGAEHRKRLVPWNEIPAERLHEVFETHLPICWNCYIAEIFRHDHPELVLDRQRDRGAGGEYRPKAEIIGEAQKRANHA